MRPLRLLCSAIVLATGLALPASAVTLTLSAQGSNIFGSNGNATATLTGTGLPSGGLNVRAGGFAVRGNLTGAGVQNFTAWCLDIATRLRLPSTYTTTNTPFSPNLLSSTTLANIERLFETSFRSLDLTRASNSAGFQLALWELVNETSGSYSLLNGNFRARNSTAAIDKANAFLAAMRTGPITQDYRLTFLQSNDNRAPGGHYSQHLVTVSAVPLPAAGLMLLGALAAMAGLRRRSATAA